VAIKLNIEIISPLEPDDRDMLTGLSIMVMAIANHELAKEHFPGVFPSPDEIAEQQRKEQGAAQEQQPMPCMAPGRGADAGKFCVNVVGHRGRHRLRFILPPSEGLN
jgi:hypothetical protein